jgi:hypothetical protein
MVRCSKHRSPVGISSFPHQRQTGASPADHVAVKQLKVSVAEKTEKGPGQMGSRAVFAGQDDQGLLLSGQPNPTQQNFQEWRMHRLGDVPGGEFEAAADIEDTLTLPGSDFFCQIPGLHAKFLSCETDALWSPFRSFKRKRAGR